MMDIWGDLRATLNIAEDNEQWDELPGYAPPVPSGSAAAEADGDAGADEGTGGEKAGGVEESAAEKPKRDPFAREKGEGMRGGSESDIGKSAGEGLRGGSKGSLGSGDAEVTQQHQVQDAKMEAEREASIQQEALAAESKVRPDATVYNQFVMDTSPLNELLGGMAPDIGGGPDQDIVTQAALGSLQYNSYESAS